MRTLRVILVLLGSYALLHVTIQSFRHVFVILVEPRQSVLAKYEPTRGRITAVDSLDQLVKQYEVAHAAVEQWKQDKTPQEIQQAEYGSEEPHMSARLYREAIETWENHQRQLRQLHFYWWCGLACLLAGIGCWHRIHHWLGVAFFVTAFGEMIYWTSPEFRVWSDAGEFSRLVLWKLLYSTATLALLLAMWTRVTIPLLRNAATEAARLPEA
jgi:hypothetical protein